jgi:alkylated DNA repair protein alkB family protein 6
MLPQRQNGSNWPIGVFKLMVGIFIISHDPLVLQLIRAITLGGVPNAKGTIIEPLPTWTKTPFPQMHALGIFENGKDPDHLLVNEYLPGQGIMVCFVVYVWSVGQGSYSCILLPPQQPHEDGPFYKPTVATISLGSHTVLDLYPPGDTVTTPAFSITLEPRSLVVLQDDAYTQWRHGIAERITDQTDTIERPRSTRISLTYRQVARPIRIPGFSLK